MSWDTSERELAFAAKHSPFAEREDREERVTRPDPLAASSAFAASRVFDVRSVRETESEAQDGTGDVEVARAVAHGERDEGKLTNMVFVAKHPELPADYKIKATDKQLAQDWLRIRDMVVRPLLRTLPGGSPAVASATAMASPASVRNATPGQITDWSRISRCDRIEYVMNELTTTFGYPENGAGGLVGNLLAESELIPNRLEGSSRATPMRAMNFQKEKKDFTALEIMNRSSTAATGPELPGVGLAQWTLKSRRDGLFQHVYEGQILGPDILFNMDAQLDYLVQELGTLYKGVDAVLRNPAVSLYDACDEVVYDFETPGSLLDANNHRRPRTDDAVIKVFEERRKLAEEALEEFQGQQALFRHEEETN